MMVFYEHFLRLSPRPAMIAAKGTHKNQKQPVCWLQEDIWGICQEGNSEAGALSG
jgi:hypothetical protein